MAWPTSMRLRGRDVRRLEPGLCTWEMAVWLRAAWQPCVAGAGKRELLLCCAGPRERSWEAASALLRRAVEAPMDAQTAAEVRTAETAGRVWGALWRLRTEHLRDRARGAGGGTPVHHFWGRLRRNARGRARPYRERAVEAHAGRRLQEGKAPYRRRVGRTAGLEARAEAVSVARGLQRVSAAEVARRVTEQVDSGEGGLGMRRAEAAGGRAVPVGVLAGGRRVGSGSWEVAWPLLREACVAEGMEEPMGGWRVIQSAGQWAEHVAVRRRGCAVGGWRGIVDEDWAREREGASWWNAVELEAEEVRGTVDRTSVKARELWGKGVHRRRRWCVVRGNQPGVVRETGEPAWTMITGRRNSLWLGGRGTLVKWRPIWGLRLLGFPTGAWEVRRTYDLLCEERGEECCWNAAARSVHVRLLAEVLRSMERRMPGRAQGQRAAVVHHCSGEWNGMWWAARLAFGARACLVGISEVDEDALDLLQRVYVGVATERDARQLAVRGEELGAGWVMMGWPCPPYSAAVRKEGRGSRAPEKRDADRWLNTRLVCEAVEAHFAGGCLESMPRGCVLENVPGLIQSAANAAYLGVLVRRLGALPVVWRVQILCPHKHLGEGAVRERVIFAGVRVDLATDGWRERAQRVEGAGGGAPRGGRG